MAKTSSRDSASLAILADEDPNWRPDHYVEEVWSCQAGLWFPAVKLWDYNERWSELEASNNPFATVVMAHLKTKATRKNNQARYEWKLFLVRLLDAESLDEVFATG